ncbi:MAG: hypothetical protein K5659_09060 [Lachnospiraceae bacterium]|nr:hypothetical protein [Lachnospiraceae bacterium]
MTNREKLQDVFSDKVFIFMKESDSYWAIMCSDEWLNSEYIDEAQKVEPEPVYFPPCVDCQDRSKEILTAYNNMKKMQTFTKEEVISMLEEIDLRLSEYEDSDLIRVEYIRQDIQERIDALKEDK